MLSAAITVGLGQPRLPVMVPWPRIAGGGSGLGVGQCARSNDLAIQTNSHTGRSEGRKMDRTRGSYPHPHARPTMASGGQPPRPISARENAAVPCRAQVGAPQGGPGPSKRGLGRLSGKIYQPGALTRDAISSVSHRPCKNGLRTASSSPGAVAARSVRLLWNGDAVGTAIGADVAPRSQIRYGPQSVRCRPPSRRCRRAVATQSLA